MKYAIFTLKGFSERYGRTLIFRKPNELRWNYYLVDHTTKKIIYPTRYEDTTLGLGNFKSLVVKRNL